MRNERNKPYKGWSVYVPSKTKSEWMTTMSYQNIVSGHVEHVFIIIIWPIWIKMNQSLSVDSDDQLF